MAMPLVGGECRAPLERCGVLITDCFDLFPVAPLKNIRFGPCGGRRRHVGAERINDAGSFIGNPYNPRMGTYRSDECVTSRFIEIVQHGGVEHDRGEPSGDRDDAVIDGVDDTGSGTGAGPKVLGCIWTRESGGPTGR